jgi:hypothetical protein
MQILVTADNDLGIHRKSAGNKFIVLRITTYRFSKFRRFDDQSLRYEKAEETLEIRVAPLVAGPNRTHPR